MATFRIHEDVENVVPNKINLIPSKLNEKRSTFAVLNNIQRGTKTHALKTVIFISNFPVQFSHHNLQKFKHKFWFSIYSVRRPPICQFQKRKFSMMKMKLQRTLSFQSISSRRLTLLVHQIKMFLHRVMSLRKWIRFKIFPRSGELISFLRNCG